MKLIGFFMLVYGWLLLYKEEYNLINFACVIVGGALFFFGDKSQTIIKKVLHERK